MLISFSISNFLSFKNKTTFTFVSNNKDDSKTLAFTAKFEKKTKNYRLNKANVIYGANASGKSNLLKAILFIKNMVLLSHDQNNTPVRLGYKPYLLCDAIKESEFEITFVMNTIIYTYSFVLHTQTAEILRETLVRYDSQKPTNLYNRTGKEISANIKFSEATERKDFVRTNGLALSVFSNMWGEESRKIREFFMTNLHIFFPEGENNFVDTIEMMKTEKENFTIFLNKLLKSADINIKRREATIKETKLWETPFSMQQFLIQNPGFSVESPVIEIQQKFIHTTYDWVWNSSGEISFTQNDESLGTNRLVALSGSLYNVIKKGMILFIDELDRSLHPGIVKEIIHLFNTEKNTKSQLVFTSHDTSLLDEEELLTPEQIWFTDKDNYGTSSLYSLDDYKGISSLKSIEKSYLAGKFKATPIINSFPFIYDVVNLW